MTATASPRAFNLTRGVVALAIAAVVVAVVACVLLGLGAQELAAAQQTALTSSYGSLLTGGSLSDAAQTAKVGAQPATIIAWVAFGLAGVLAIGAVVLHVVRSRPAVVQVFAGWLLSRVGPTVLAALTVAATIHYWFVTVPMILLVVVLVRIVVLRRRRRSPRV